MRLWHFSSSVNSFFKRACAACGARCLIFCWILHLLPYFKCANSKSSDALARLRGCAGSPEPSLVAYVISTICSSLSPWRRFGSLATLATDKVHNEDWSDRVDAQIDQMLCWVQVIWWVLSCSNSVVIRGDNKGSRHTSSGLHCSWPSGPVIPNAINSLDFWN